VEKQRADAIIKSAEDALGAAVLLGRVRTGQTEDGAVRGKKGAKSDVVKLFSVIGLECKDGAIELCGDIRIK
jgi:hypothetical protein